MNREAFLLKVFIRRISINVTMIKTGINFHGRETGREIFSGYLLEVMVFIKVMSPAEGIGGTQKQIGDLMGPRPDDGLVHERGSSAERRAAEIFFYKHFSKSRLMIIQ